MMAAGIAIGVVTAVVMVLWALPMVGFWLMDKINNAGVDNDESH